MIPKITHSRSQLRYHFNKPQDNDGTHSIYVSSDTYPELFELSLPAIVKRSPQEWIRGKMAGLLLPDLDKNDIDSIQEWCDRFEQYVLLCLSTHIMPFFSDELDFCMALDFNKTDPQGPRTELGEAVYRIKYQGDHSFIDVLQSASIDAFSYLPIPTSESAVISCIPSDPSSSNVAKSLAEGVAKAQGFEFIQADLLCNKTAMKDLSIEKKSSNGNGFTIVMIVLNSMET